MRFIRGNLTLTKPQKSYFYLQKTSNFAFNFAKNEVLLLKWCKNYTIGNFTIM